MAQLCRGQRRQVRILWLALSLVIVSSLCTKAQTLYERPVLIVDPDMHTDVSRTAAADTAGRFLVTGSEDRTVRIWSASDGKLLRTIRVPAGPDYSGRVYAVAMSPDGSIVAAGGYLEDSEGLNIYLFDRNTGKMTTRIGGLPNVGRVLVFSADGRYLAAVCSSGGLRVFDRDKNWSEAFRDASYDGESWGAAFASDGRLATSSADGKIRLYDGSFKLVATQQVRKPARLAFRPDGKVLAVGEDMPSVDLLDGQTLARLPGPDVHGLDNEGLFLVAWSADGQTLFATGRHPVLAWNQAGRGTRRAITAKCAESDDVTLALVSLPAGRLLVAKGSNPCFAMLKADGAGLWAHRPAGGDFRGQQETFSVSADGTVVDFWFEPFGKSPLRFDLRALKLSNQRPADDRTRPAGQNGLEDLFTNHTEIELDKRENLLSLAIHPDTHRLVLGTQWKLRALDAEGKHRQSSSEPNSIQSKATTDRVSRSRI